MVIPYRWVKVMAKCHVACPRDHAARLGRLVAGAFFSRAMTVNGFHGNGE